MIYTALPVSLYQFVLLADMNILDKHESGVKRGFYMTAHVSWNLLNELEKRDKTRGLPSILSLFRNEFNKFNNTRA